MAYGFLDIAVTPAVRAAQGENGVAEMWQDFKGHREFDRFDEPTKSFIEVRDSFYLASVSETGWPYVQHRGGPPGFLKVIDDRTMAFADYRGNRQYISMGNIAANDRVCLFLVDYPRRTRLKIYAHAEVVALESDPALRALVEDPQYRGRPERLFRLRLAAFDWNCAQHITPRFTSEQLAEVLSLCRPNWPRSKRKMRRFAPPIAESAGGRPERPISQEEGMLAVRLADTRAKEQARSRLILRSGPCR